MASLTPQGPDSPKSLLHVATVLAPSHSKVQVLLTGQSRDVTGESSEGLLNKMVHLRNQWLPHVQARLPSSITQITRQERAHALHSLRFCHKYFLFVIPEMPHEQAM